MPTINQLANVISKGNDSVNNRLILKTDGDFELVPFNTSEDSHRFQQLNYVTRWETYDAGNDYVGQAASMDTNHLNRIMDWANEAWTTYQQTGRTKILNPFS